jgi:ribosome recycling factor
MAALTIAEIKKTAEFKMGKTVEALKHEMQKVRTGRAHPGILDQVHVSTTARWCRSARWPT